MPPTQNAPTDSGKFLGNEGGIGILPQWESGITPEPPVLPGNFSDYTPPPTAVSGGIPTGRAVPFPTGSAYPYPIPGLNNSWRTSATGGINAGYDWTGTGQDVGRSVGNFFGQAVAPPLPGLSQLGGFLGRQVGSVLGHGIGGLFGSISHGLGSIFGGGNETPPAQPAGPAEIPTLPAINVFNGSNVNPGVRQTYDTGRFTGAPAFSGTLAQSHFPGSPIGPTSGAISNPYGNPGGFTTAGLSRVHAGWDTSIPGWAAAAMAGATQGKLL